MKLSPLIMYKSFCYSYFIVFFYDGILCAQVLFIIANYSTISFFVNEEKKKRCINNKHSK